MCKTITPQGGILREIVSTQNLCIQYAVHVFIISCLVCETPKKIGVAVELLTCAGSIRISLKPFSAATLEGTLSVSAELLTVMYPQLTFIDI